MSILGVFLVRAPENATMKNLIFTLERSIWIAAALIAVIMLGVLQIVDLGEPFAMGICLALYCHWSGGGYRHRPGDRVLHLR